MEWIRRRPTAAAVVGVVSVLAVLALVFLLISPKSDPPDTSSIGDLSTVAPSPTAEPTLPELTPSASPTAASTLSASELKKQTQKAFDQIGKGYSLGGLSSGSLSMQGLQGGSVYQYLPKHTLVLRVTASVPIGTVGYIIPTSLKKSSGIVKNVGTGWSLTTTVFGDPDYSQIYLQADAIGHPITCNISVDGRTVERRSTEGPYARLICQG